MTAFDRCLAVVLGHEGNDTMTDDPRDPGGLTRYGISQRSHPGVDVRGLTRELAAEIYRATYWRPLLCDQMPVAVALCVFDCAVNQGTQTAARLIQDAAGTKQDGVIGAVTLRAITRSTVGQIVRRMMTARVHRYLALPGLSVYGRGWLARCVDITATAIEWSHP